MKELRQGVLHQFYDFRIRFEGDDRDDSPVKTFPPSAPKSGARLPEVDVPTFDLLNWSVFWDRFLADLYDPLADSDKIFYLGTAIKSREGQEILKTATGSGDDYPDIVDTLK